MSLSAIFLILYIHLSHIFATHHNPLELSLQPSHNLKGFECGNIFFTYEEVKNTLSLALDSIDKGYRFPQRYLGPLYSESKFEEHFLYPIKNRQRVLPYAKKINTVHYIVLTRTGIEEVDVVAKIANDYYTRCIRRYSTHAGLSQSVPESPNGYLCGHEFFTDEIIHQSHALAQTKIEGNPKYPSPYVGNLYPEQSGLLVWPIWRGKALYKSGAAKIGPYFLILNNERQFVDVVIRGYMNNFLRCIRSRKPPKAPASDPNSKLFVPPPKSGYICGKIFFDIEVLEMNLEIAKKQAGKKTKGKYPIEYSGPPFNEQCLMWPLLLDGSLFKSGNKGSYRLILTPGYKVMSVAMIVNGKLKVCERKIIKAKKNHDTSDYHCNEQLLSHQKLVVAAEEACVKMSNGHKNFYPARYKGPGFMIDGPYFTYPAFENKARKFRSHTGLHRVVINTNCEIVGALTTLQLLIYGGPDHGLQKRLVKCHRLDDGPLPQGFFDANAQTVFEH